MPVYEYVCDNCAIRFEELRPLSRMHDAATCPDGHAGGQRVLSTFAALSSDSLNEAGPVGGGGCGGGCTGCSCGAN